MTLILSTTQNTDQTTTSSTYVDVSGTETGALVNGVEYAVFFRCNIANQSAGSVGDARLVFGTTEIMKAAAESASPNESFSGDQVQGVAVVTGNGSDTLKFQFLADGGSGTAVAGAASIVAIPLDTLTEGTDWFYDQGSDTPVNLNTTATTINTATFTIPDNGNYIVISCCETSFDAGSGVADAARVQMSIAGVAPRPDPDDLIGGFNQKEWEDDRDVFTWCLMKVQSLVAGSNTFVISGASRDVSGDVNGRRGNILVLRAASFDQLQFSDTVAAAAEGTSTTAATYQDVTDLDVSYTPNQVEKALVLGFVPTVSSDVIDSTVLQLQNVTDAVNYLTDAGQRQNDGGLDSGADNPVVFLPALATGLTVAAKTFRVEVRATNAGDTAGAGRNQDDTAACDSTLLVLSMEGIEAGPVGEQPAIFFGCDF